MLPLRVSVQIATTRRVKSSRRMPLESKRHHRASSAFRIHKQAYATETEAPRWEVALQNLKVLLNNSQFAQAVREANDMINSQFSLPSSALSIVIQALATQGVDSVRQALPRLREKIGVSLIEIDETIWSVADLLVLAEHAADSSTMSSLLTKQLVEFITSGKLKASAPENHNVIDILLRTSTHLYDIESVAAVMESVFAAIKHKADQSPMVQLVSPGSIQMVTSKAYKLHRPDIVERVFATAEEIGVSITNAMYFHLLSAKCMKFELAQVPQLLRTLIIHKVPLQVGTITFIMRACVTAHNLEVADSCWKMWRDAELHFDTRAANTFLLAVYLYGTSERIDELWNRRSSTDLPEEKLDQEAYNIAVRCELRRGKFERALVLLTKMQELQYGVDHISVRHILRESMFDFANLEEVQPLIMDLSAALAREAVTDDPSKFEITQAIADSLPVYGSQSRLAEMQATFDMQIRQPDLYSVARLIEGYLLADAVAVAYSYYEALMLPLLKEAKPPSNFEGVRLAAIAALTVRAKATKNADYFLTTWKMIKAIPTFLPRTIYAPFGLEFSDVQIVAAPQVYAEFINLGKSLLVSPIIMFKEISEAVDAGESGAMTISSQLTRAFVTAYIRPLDLEKDQKVIRKWSELPLYRDLVAGKSVFSTWTGGMVTKRAKGGKEVRISPKLNDANLRIAAKQLKQVNKPVLLTASETSEFKRDLQRWAKEFAKRTEGFGIWTKENT